MEHDRGGRPAGAGRRPTYDELLERVARLEQQQRARQRDISERKHAEEALREADRRRTEFLAVLSHELRNPLAPIRNSVFLLERAPPGGDQARRARQIIERQTAHLARLVDDLLDLNRISRGKVELHRERIDLADLVFRTAEDHRAHFHDHGIAFEVQLLGTLEQLLGQPRGARPGACSRGPEPSCGASGPGDRVRVSFGLDPGPLGGTRGVR
jgi:signal transduction histidine kinase